MASNWPEQHQTEPIPSSSPISSCSRAGERKIRRSLVPADEIAFRLAHSLTAQSLLLGRFQGDKDKKKDNVLLDQVCGRKPGIGVGTSERGGHRIQRKDFQSTSGSRL
jgi:hypothetical protein